MRHYDSDPDENPWVRGKPAPESIAIVAYDPEWPARYDGLAADLRRALGPVALDIQHIGSTAVPGLPAKPVIDIDVAVADPTREDLYAAGPGGAGLRAARARAVLASAPLPAIGLAAREPARVRP